MSTLFCADVVELANEFHSFLVSIDPSKLKADLALAASDRMSQISARLQTLLKRYENVAHSEQFATVYDRLQRLKHEIDQRMPTADLSAERLRKEWLIVRKRLLEQYSAISTSLGALSIQTPTLRPTNYTRSFFHFGTGLVVLFLMMHVFSGQKAWMIAAWSFTAWAWSMELLRRYSKLTNRILMWAFGPIAHPHEHHRVNSATWYGTALALLSLFAPPEAATTGVIVLAAADPMAGWVGRNWGKHKITRSKTMEGALAFGVTAFLFTMLLFSVYFGGLAWPDRLVLAGVAAVSGALAELFTGGLDDNFTIPLVVGGTVYGAQIFV
ncbi:MAG: hypothetical protein HUU55_00305 [Myxococcales bacterium]|nr:hypothetical protein [Myxococcales bacterium]